MIRFLAAHELPVSGPEGYLRKMLELGARGIAENALAEVRILGVEDVSLPLLIVEPAPGNCDLCSPTAHHVRYSMDEVLLRTAAWAQWPVRLAYALYGGLLSLGRIDRVIYVNNWLYSTNPAAELNEDQVQRMRIFLEQQYPGHAQVIRSIQPEMFPGQGDLIADAGYKLIKGRDVFTWPYDDSSYLERKNYHKDSRLLERSDVSVTEPEAMDPDVAARLRVLYSELYLQKHNRLNACLTESFFLSTFETGALRYRFLVKKDRIVGFYCFIVRQSVCIAIALGYDLSVPKTEGLYRQIVMSCIREAREQGWSLSFSAGVKSFKASRGGQEIIEFEGVRFAHLPLRQRLAWRVLQAKCRMSEASSARSARGQSIFPGALSRRSTDRPPG